MSKAFTKESDHEEDDDQGEGPELLPKGTRNYITPTGAKRLQEELKKLLHVDRPDLVKVVSWAASNGDRSENADYIYGKRRLREMDRRIRFLSKRLESAEVVDPVDQGKKAGDRVLFGATVTVLDEQNREHVYTVVGVDEIDVKRGHISWVSPVAKALINAKDGDVVTFMTPKGEKELEVIKIQYKAF